jgi:acetyl-CoA carboxylase biotin carboxyl carrier protein
MALRYDEISEILRLIDSSSCDEFVLETDEIKLVVGRRRATSFAVDTGSDPDTIGVGTPDQPQQLRPSAWTAASPGAANIVTSPMVGTFYRSPSPGAPPFIEIGSKVSKGDPICIIEVMKLLTTIHAEWSGTVTEIGAENAAPVEYGQMLFVIEPAV